MYFFIFDWSSVDSSHAFDFANLAEIVRTGSGDQLLCRDTL